LDEARTIKFFKEPTDRFDVDASFGAYTAIPTGFSLAMRGELWIFGLGPFLLKIFPGDTVV